MRRLRFIVNPTSGGRRGLALQRGLRLQTTPEQVLDLRTCDLDGVARLAGERGEALIACGGDGTAAAVLDAVARSGVQVPVGVIPLGTGNDLARALGWGGHGPGRYGLDGMLTRLHHAGVGWIDRWCMAHAVARPFSWFNYFSIGVDARIARRFHVLRERIPGLFRHPLGNKLLYAAVALGEPSLPLHRACRLQGRSFPDWAQAVVLANIPSYAGGACLGRDLVRDDGVMDAFALGPGAVLGLAASGLRRPRCLERASAFTLDLPHAIIAQRDGEPCRLAAGRWRITSGGRVRVLIPG